MSFITVQNHYAYKTTQTNLIGIKMCIHTTHSVVSDALCRYFVTTMNFSKRPSYTVCWLEYIHVFFYIFLFI